MSSLHFYRDLPEVPSLEQAVEAAGHREVPADWWVVIADLIGSSEAIAAGGYKDVNTVGVACIAAVLNVDRTVAMPFVFGGDGATLAVPGALREPVMAALRQAQRMAREGFGMRLRVGLVPVSDLLARDLWVRVARVRLSPQMQQSAFSGRGWNEAERLVKDAQANGVVRVEEHDGPCEGSFEGFECRWDSVPSFQDHKLAILVAALSGGPTSGLQTYRDVLGLIARIYGEVARYHPLQAQAMRLSFNPAKLSHEWRVRSGHLGVGARLGYFLQMVLQSLAGTYLFAAKKDTKTTGWSRYIGDMVDNSDFRKFDGMLRMVIDGSEAQYQALRAGLDDLHRAGRLVYGLHPSREALLTCIVFAHDGNHLHFVDGSDGGYALAARAMKRQLQALRG
ncbi:MAG: DUF3095 domain-containing protein [Polaromonas sp.]|nr:DUF3095 domain-containing protein [Polaromonas sp.]